MHKIIQNLIDIQKKIDSNLESLTINKVPKIIAVSKTFGMDKISPLIDHGHLDFGENKVQEALDKWSDIKVNNKNLKLLTRNHVYSKEMEHDACGVGVIASTEGKKSREIVEYGIQALKSCMA